MDVIAELTSRGAKVGVALPSAANFDRLGERYFRAGAQVVRLDTDARSGRAAQAGALLDLSLRLHRWKPDVVHLHKGGATGGLAVLAVARLTTSALVVLTEHDMPKSNPTRYQKLARHALDRVTKVLIVNSRKSAKMRRERLGAPDSRFAVVPLGIPMRTVTGKEKEANRARIRGELGVADDEVLFGSLVRLAPGKGLDDLLKAFSTVTKEARCHLLLVGDGPLRDELLTLAAGLGIADRVTFAGYQEEPAPFLDALDAFALAVTEGSGSIALLQAMANGLPSVITYCGPEEAVVPEKTGLCAAPRDPVSLAGALRRLVADAALRARLGAAASAYVSRHYTIQRVVDDLLELYSTAGSTGVPLSLRADQPADTRPITYRPAL